MNILSRRLLLRRLAAGALGSTWGLRPGRAADPEPGERPERSPGFRVLYPRARTPVGMIIDDSTCLVNLAHYAMPQFAEVWPERADYQKPWRTWPREIPDAFVREFGEWCAERGVKGKYSIVPYPACVGWVDRDLPGWSRRQLEESVALARDLMMRHWDIHPEMVSHTWVIDTRTGRPHEERSERFMENWRWTDGRSVDELADYVAYALQILRNAGFTCEGVTTPGGFAGRVPGEFAQAAFQACREVFGTEIPHYFKYVETGEGSTAPRVEYVSGLAGNDPRCVVSLIAGTGDWFGGWDGVSAEDEEVSADRLVTADGQGGRLPELIGRGEPAYMLCHWPGIYCNGEETGFRIFQRAVERLREHHGEAIVWMKLGELARYGAARELTGAVLQPREAALRAPFAAPEFTVEIESAVEPAAMEVERPDGTRRELRRLRQGEGLAAETWTCGKGRLTACFDLAKGANALRW